MLLGLNTNVVSDMFIDTNNRSLAYQTASSSLSCLYFLDHKENGAFLRADMGSSQMAIIKNDGTKPIESDKGFGLALGVGAAYDMGGTSIMATLLVASYKAGEARTNSAQFLISFLF
jgi:hypothetical protein